MTDLVTGNQIDIAAFDSGMSNDDKIDSPENKDEDSNSQNK